MIYSNYINNILFFSIFLILFSCNNSSESQLKQDSTEYAKYISGFTSGIISTQSDIIIELKDDVKKDKIKEVNLSELFEFKPSIKGDFSWIDDRTIKFSPNKNLGSMQLYSVNFNLGKLIKVPKNMEIFSFEFQSKKIDFRINIDGMEAYGQDLTWQKFSGKIITSDIVTKDLIKKIVQAQQKRKKLNISWKHDADGVTHDFTVDSVKRLNTREILNISWNGNVIGVEKKGDENFEIPPLGDFKMMNVSVSQQPSQSIEIRFSDPIRKNTNLNGLIYLQSNEEIDISIDRNLVTIYPKQQLNGDKVLKISKSIKNSLGTHLIRSFEYNVNFASPKPAVELIGDGVILPNTDGLIFPFKAVNLSAVNVKVIRIYEDNIAQFFQENTYEGYRELTRVGRIIYKDDVILESDKDIDYSSWNTFALDLSKMIKTEPGAIYRVMISFKMSQSLFPCADGNYSNLEQSKEFEDEYFDNSNSYWYGSNNYNYPNKWYSWSEQDDPCKLAYYAKNKHSVVRNVFASNMGIIAKNSDNGELKTVITDLKTTDPISGVKVELYNLQNRLISSSTTNSEGIASFNIEKKPFLLIAKKGNERGYLKLDDGSSLSMSMFNTSGSYSQEGLKGYLYGDRGVWRPGDSLFISFILEDKNNLLPKNHPVNFTLFNAKGQIYKEIVKTHGLDGFYVFKIKTDQEDETGNWKVEVKVGDSYFSKQLRVETIKPNRLKVNFDFGGELLRNLYSKEIKLTSTWLHGSPAKNLKTTIEIDVSEQKTKFQGYDQYNFDDYIKTFASQKITIKEQELDINGKMSFKLPFRLKDPAPGMLQVNFNTRVFEKGGDASISRDMIKYSPYRSYVGLNMPEGNDWRGAIYSDEKNILPIVTIDEFGNQIDRKNLKIEIFKLDWNYWYENTNRYEISRYVTGSSRDLIYSGEINTVGGEAMHELDMKKDIWGKCYVRITDPISGHSCGEVFYMTYRGYWSTSSVNTEGAEILSFSTDKKKYNVGEDVTVTLPEAKKGRVLISLESGSEIIKTFWVNINEQKNSFKFKATEDMSPNIYLNICLIQPHKNTENDLPIRLYGVKGISIEDPKTHLNPIITMSDELRPEENVKIKISESNGKKMTYTIAVVDDGLLDLTGFKTPSPWEVFYAWQALKVKTWDIYKYVSGAFTGKMAGLLEIGGDEYVKNEDKKKANRFIPVVKFLGPFTLEAGKKATHTFKMPNYVGSVRTMVVAGNNGAYGSASKTTSVKKPLMVLATLPRVAGPLEDIELPVTVFAMNDNIKNVEIKVETNDMFEAIGSETKYLSFTKSDDQIVRFRLSVKNDLGVGKVKVTAKSKKETASYEVEMNIRMPNPKITRIISKSIKPKENWRKQYKGIGIKGTNRGIIEVSVIPPINLENRLNDLIRYPHGCIEQTTSSIFPQLYLSVLTDLSEKREKEIQRNITKGLNRIKSFQTSDGGFTYWPNSGNEANEWGTNYGGHFILEAKNKGYDIPIGLLSNWINFQTDKANNYVSSKRGGSELTQAYRLYTLALSGKPALSAMNNMRGNINLSNIAKWRLAAAYQLIGRTDIANDLIFNIAVNSSTQNYKEQQSTYGSKIRDEAMILEALSLVKEFELAEEIVRKISSKLSSSDYMSTQTKAYALLAISKYINSDEKSKEFSFTYELNSKTVKEACKKPLKQIDLMLESNSEGIFNILNTSNKTLFATMQLEGIPMYDGNPINEDSRLRMSVQYKSMEGYLIDPSFIRQGTDFIAEVTILHPGTGADYKDLALTQIFPSGWEIRNSRMDLVQSTKTDPVTYQDIRDDRVYTYFDIERNETKVFQIQLNASYLGKYYLPIVNCEAMYDNKINSKEGGQWVEVVE